MSKKITHLKELESEAIYVIREIAAQFEKPVLLFSGGKDSQVVLDLVSRGVPAEDFVVIYIILILNITLSVCSV